jgi:hypothetical protein
MIDLVEVLLSNALSPVLGLVYFQRRRFGAALGFDGYLSSPILRLGLSRYSSCRLIVSLYGFGRHFISPLAGFFGGGHVLR